jgi:anti-sigma factor RsiW
MTDGYASSPQDDHSAASGEAWEDLDEYLCEYVDGTMDRCVRAAFEEYLAANPGARAHVEALKRTRMLLGACPCTARAPENLRARLHGCLAPEITCGATKRAHQVRAFAGFALAASAVAVFAVGLSVLASPVEGAADTPEVARAPAATYHVPLRAEAPVYHIVHHAEAAAPPAYMDFAAARSHATVHFSAKPARIHAPER